MAKEKETEGNGVKADGKPVAGQLPEETPSMEEILRSIRGVISGTDSEGGGDAGGDSPVAAGGADAEEDVLELTDMLEEVNTAADVAEVDVSSEAEDSKDNLVADLPEQKSVLDDIDNALAEAPKEEPVELVSEPQEENLAEEILAVDKEEDSDILVASGSDEELSEVSGVVDGKLISEEVAGVSKGTLKTLVNSIPKQTVNSPVTRGGSTLEDLVIEAMKPFLADWLNKNLPVIVKQLVEKEIKKLVPRDDE